MPKHQFALHDVVVRKMNAKKDAERLLHDFTGKGDDLLPVFNEFLHSHIGSGRACKKNRYIKLVKQVQTMCMQKFSSSYYFLTTDYYDFISSKIKAWEVVQSYPKYHLEVWLGS